MFRDILLTKFHNKPELQRKRPGAVFHANRSAAPDLQFGSCVNGA